MSLVEHAESELALAGLAGDDGYDGMMYTGVMEIVQTFAAQGHSGFSAGMSVSIIEKLLRYEPLTPLAFDDTEWVKHDDTMWQNRRKSTVFSDDQGRTWYDIDEEGRPRHVIGASE